VRAAVLEGPGALRLVDVPVPVAEPGQVLVRIALCGICGTDFHVVDGRSRVELPYRNLGHEYVGTVVDVGAGVRTVGPGDRVVIDPNYHCDSCDACRRGETGFCTNRRALRVKSNGGFAEYSAVAEKLAVRVPVDLADEAAIFAEPLSCCLHGCERAELRAGEHVLLYGCGTMGLLILQLLRAGGAGRIVVSDPVAARRAAAVSLGADRAVDPAREDLPRIVASELPGGPRLVVESAGAPGTLAEAVRLAAPRARVLLLATWGDEAQVSLVPELVVRREISLVGTIFGTDALSRSVGLLAAGRIATVPLLTTLYRLEELPEAMRVAMGRDAIKVAVRPGPLPKGKET
jgi:L-iditol 2-dehydrogenase